MNQQQLFELAQQYIPGGVNSPVRSFNAVGGTPFFTNRAHDCYLYDSEDNRYIDYVCSWGANIVGHANSQVISQVTRALSNGFSYGTPTELEIEFAREICKLLPSVEKFRLVSSGTEATMSALRVARGYTSRKYIIKFNGCYHGHSDALLVKAGSGAQTFGSPSSAGITPESVQYTIVLEYNDIEQLELAFNSYPDQIAGVIIEPFAGNMNLVRPTVEFIQKLRKLCTDHGSVLIFDEVMTGFRVDLGGAQKILGITPDLTTLGKIIGGGMPLAGFGGKQDIMDRLSPVGDVYQAGTLSGNPIAVTAGLANLRIIQQPQFYVKLSSLTQQLTTGLNSIAKHKGIPLCADAIGGMFGYYFLEQIPSSFAQVKKSNQVSFTKFFHYMLDHGVFFAPSMFEAGFICSAHTQTTINETLNIAEQAILKAI